MSVSQTIATCMMSSVALVESVALVVLLFSYKLTLVFISSQHNFHSSSGFLVCSTESWLEFGVDMALLG